jgi:hypothetical protein
MRIDNDYETLAEIIRANRRAKRAKKLLYIWPVVMKILPFPRFRLKLVNFLLDFGI